MTPEEISLVATAVALFLSELLPFVSQLEGNGFVHVLLLVVQRLLVPTVKK